MTAVNFNMRLDQDLKDRSSEVLESYGLTTAQAVKLFLTQVVRTNSVPLSFDYAKDSVLTPKAEARLRQSICERENGEYSKYDTLDDAMQAMRELG
ncbi:MAG: type II toxin-antitoxin system RelB/DinJ family antitoxin [Acinetobacter sp.]|nr:MAG: type II toxin-antitoxin system RelB/DinJ family antitoxin [Acinetobacter sp.]